MTRKHYAGVPAEEVIAFAKLMNELELQHVGMFGDSVNSAIATNVKAADLKGQQVSIRGLARVRTVEPASAIIARMTKEAEVVLARRARAA